MTKNYGGSWASWIGAGAFKMNPKVWIFSVGVLLLLSFAEAQNGFISIDCGSTSNYTDDRGIEWTTDAGYIATGSSVNITIPPSTQDPAVTENSRQLSSARSFPSSRQKNCYLIPGLVSNASYLIRVSLFYGNLTPAVPTGYTFRVSVDSTIIWHVNINANTINTVFTGEVFVATTSQELTICILPVTGIPFISSLELRRLDSTMYRGYMFCYQYGILLGRLDAGASTTAQPIRYPDDTVDRVWWPPGSTYKDYYSPNTSTTLNLGAENLDETPVAVMQTAWSIQPETDSDHFSFSLQVSGNQKYYAGFYFAEILESRTATESRIIDIRISTMDGKNDFTGWSIPSNGSELVLWDNGGTTAALTTQLTFSFYASPSSTLPPLLNAFEFHNLFFVNTSSTVSSNRDVVDAIRKSLNLMDWVGDPCYPVSYDWITCSADDPALVTQIKLSNYQLQGTIPPSIATLSALTALWLDDNLITGSIPDLSRLTYLQTLHLQNNSLTGPIPDSLADIPKLTELFLQENNFSGTVPAALLNKNGLNLLVDPSNSPPGTSPSTPATSPATPTNAPKAKSKKKSSSGAIMGGVAAVIIAVILSLVFLCICIRRRQWTRFRGDQQKPSIRPSEPNSLAVFPVENENARSARAFSMAELNKFTNDWQQKIGEGGYGPVYYGKLDNGSEVAVKLRSESSGQGSKEFATEVSLLSRIHHRNLVHLIGFCNEDNKNILVYEFMEEGTLQGHLYGKGDCLADFETPLNWTTRLQIAIEAARGLEYLHNDCNPRIVHRDVKSTNILLDENLHAKVADFGISKAHEEDKTQQQSSAHRSVRGTLGYMDPEYLQTSMFTYKSDVYAFGVVLLELISGRPPISPDFSGERHVHWSLVDYTRQMLSEGRLEEVADRSLRDYNMEAMWKVAELAMRCVEYQSINRPNMREVVGELCEASQYKDGMGFRTVEFDGEDDTTPVFTHSSSNSRSSTQSLTQNSYSQDSTQWHPPNSYSRYGQGGPPRYGFEFPTHPSHQQPNVAGAYANNNPRNNPKNQRAATEPWGQPAPR